MTTKPKKPTVKSLLDTLYRASIEHGNTRDAVLSAWPIGSAEHSAAKVVQGDLTNQVRQIIAERDAARAEAAMLRRTLRVSHEAAARQTET